MIQVKKKLFRTFDEAYDYFEPGVRCLTNTFMGDSGEKDDCRQMLRLKVWKLFEDPDRVFNSNYVSRRLKWDVINFINRDPGYNWTKTFSSLESLMESENPKFLALLEVDTEENADRDVEIEDIILRSRPHLSPKQYEALTLFLSGASSEMIRRFLGTRSRNMTRYYLLLAESFAIIREVVGYDGED